MSIEDSIKRLKEAHAEHLAGHDDGGREYLAACTPDVVGYLLAALDEREALREVPAGWKLVPVEPTWDMKMAASSNYREPRDGHYTARMECAADAYAAMLAAAPPAPAQPAQGGGVVEALGQARSALQKTMGVWGGTCAWHADVKAAIAAIDAARKEPT